MVGGEVEVLLVHPGGPLWARRDAGAWSIPKGEIESEETPEEVATREFGEELGHPPPAGRRASLGEVVQGGGKRVVAWALRGDLRVADVRSNQFEMEWPPRSGRRRSFPEVDRASWFSLDEARHKLVRAQAAFVDRLSELVAPDGSLQPGGPGTPQPDEPLQGDPS